MNVRDAGEALYLACEMERRAIRLYERALMVFGESPCQEAISRILCDERSHLSRFLAMGGKEPGFERAQLLSAQASGVLFSGGLVEAQRKGAFDEPKSLYAYAAEEEAGAARRYGEFAAQLTGDAAAAFSAIALEEEQHYLKLISMAASQ